MATPTKPVIFVLHHFPGECVHFNGTEYSAIDGIPRVVRLMVRALVDSGLYKVKVTARRDQVQNFKGFFQAHTSADLEVVCLEDLIDQKVSLFSIFRKILPLTPFLKDEPGPAPAVEPVMVKIDRKANLTPQFGRVEKILKRLVYGGFGFLISPLILLVLLVRPLSRLRGKKFFVFARQLDLVARTLRAFELRLGPIFLIQRINRLFPKAVVLIPHYHLFPEALDLEAKSVMYIPDFTPHFFEESGEFGPHVQESAIGQSLVRKTSAVITNSLYSKSYLPETRLQVPTAKITMFYLPNLNPEKAVSSAASLEVSEEIQKFRTALQGSSFLFYPTQPRQNKRLDLLFSIFDSLSAQKPGLQLVLTNYLVPGSTFEKAFQKMKFKHQVVFFPHVSDGGLSWLYQQASALVFTSAMEGNFPPQVFEALFHRLPVVATRLPLITERLGDLSDHLLLCAPQDTEAYVQGLLRCLKERDAVLERQEPVRTKILAQGEVSVFNQEVLSFFARETA